MKYIELDDDGQLAFTRKNCDFIIGMIRFNETYDLFYDRDLFLSECKIDKNKNIDNFTKDEWRNVIKLLDKINSTHLSSSGNKKGDNHGVELFLSGFYCMQKDFLKRIAFGEGGVVNELADLVNARNNFSFATKFCAFINRVFYNRDDFVIFDSILESVMSYFELNYCGKIDQCRCLRAYADERDYSGYHAAIDSVLEEIKRKCCDINRFEFDQMVWFYYKNKPSKLKEIKEKQYKNK